MKIGYFNTVVPYKNPFTNELLTNYEGCGGVENVVYNLSIGMAERGHEVHVFTSSMSRNESLENYGKIFIYRYKKSFRIGRSPVSFDLFYKPLKVADLDIVHAHLGNLPAPLTGYWYAKKWKKPFIITYHGEYIENFGDPIRRLGVVLHKIYFANKLLSKADAVIVSSKYNIDESKILKKYSEKIRIIPNGINLEEFDISYSKEKCRDILNIPQDKKVILFVGNLIQIKAPHILIGAMKYITEKIPNAHLFIVGDGKIQNNLKKQSRLLGIEKNVTFVGAINDTNKKVLYYKASDVFVLPSFSECFPIVLLEASACGLPLVVSNLESLKAIVKEGYNGLFIKTGDKKDLAEKIVYLFENEEVMKNFGRNSKSDVQEFSWKKIIQETEQVYMDVIDKYKC
jgi:glycosyltransferase involved in cell wall biosynthesis